ncbi:MAG: metal-dependent transcriptional regulator [Holosporales bacterium]|jgi:DtxR family Mn-dependent transcriptional regulator|nr:metal-dependent transcriptional regulator [Holosporales bacterium]
MVVEAGMTSSIEDTVTLTPSQENYLKTIYIKVSQDGYAKMSDIANMLSVQKSSVNTALNILARGGYINYTPYSQITLTELGLDAAKRIIEKFKTMDNFFCNILKLSKEEAATNSCRIEHIISEELFRKISKFFEFTEELYLNDPDYKKKLDDLLS